jgi:hypothetical protein
MSADTIPAFVEIDVCLEPEYDHRPDDHFEDADTLHWVRNQLARGNEWAWTSVSVQAVAYSGAVGVSGKVAIGTAFRGGCSYLNEQDFKTGGYYEDLVAEAVRELRAELELVLAEGIASAALLDSWASDDNRSVSYWQREKARNKVYHGEQAQALLEEWPA